MNISSSDTNLHSLRVMGGRKKQTNKENKNTPSLEIGVSLASASDSLELLPEDFLVASVDWMEM